MCKLKRDKAKLEETLKRAQKSGDSKMVAWCENQLKCYASEMRVAIDTPRNYI